MIPDKTKIQKLTASVLLVCAIGGTMMLGSVKASAGEVPSEYRYKYQQVMLPPEIATFVNAKEQQAEALARKQNLELDPAVKEYFAAVQTGRVGEAQQLFQDISAQARATNATGNLSGPVWQVVIDVVLAADAVGNNDPDLVLATARAMTGALPPGCIYFGGTDPGRGLPTMLCSAPGDPFFVLTQNALEEGRYMNLLRAEYGSRIQLPTTNEVQKCIDDYKADVQLRAKQGKLKPGENFRVEDGKPKIEGQFFYMEINALITKSIFDKNPDREFYYEESFPLDWMYPYLSPRGLLMKLNRQPLNEMAAEEIQKNEDFWSKIMEDKIGGWLTKDTPVSNVCFFAEKVFAKKDLSGFKGDSKFIASEYIMAYTKWRDSIAGIYAWRLSPQCPPEYRPKNGAQRKQLMEVTDFAYRQAFALCPFSPEAVYSYVNFLLQLGRFDDAILIAKTDLACTPKDGPFSHNEQIKGLIDQLEKYKSQAAARAPVNSQDLGRLEKDFGSNQTNFSIGLDLVHAYLSGGQTNKAHALLDQMVVSKDINASVLQNIAGIYAQLGNLGKLETALARWTEVTPESPEVWNDLAALKAILGKKSEAIADLKKALALNSQRLLTNPSARDLASQLAKDPRFNSLKTDPEFQRLMPH